MRERVCLQPPVPAAGSLAGLGCWGGDPFIVPKHSALLIGEKPRKSCLAFLTPLEPSRNFSFSLTPRFIGSIPKEGHIAAPLMREGNTCTYPAVDPRHAV